MDAADKTAIIEQFRRDPQDTGSTEVQIAVLTQRIRDLTDHLRQFPKDTHSRRGLYGLVSRRRRLMRYMARRRPDQYRALITELGIRG